MERLHLRITVAGERVEISLGKKISAGIFDQNAQRCLTNSKEAKSLNSFHDTIRYKVNDLRKTSMDHFFALETHRNQQFQINFA